MIKNFLKAGIRRLLRDRLIATLYVGCLGVGISGALLLFNYYQFESSYDTTESRVPALYRVNTLVNKSEGQSDKNARTSPALGEYMKDHFSQVASYSRLVLLGEAILLANDTKIKEEHILLADTAHFNQFNYSLLPGSSISDFNKPMSVFISESLARTLFKDENPIDQTIGMNSVNLDGSVEFNVEGVFEDRALNSHLRPNLLISYSTLLQFVGNEINQSWDWNNLYTYVRLHDASKQHELVNQLNTQIQTDFKDKFGGVQFSLQDVAKIHTDLETDGAFMNPVNGETLTYIGGIALFILFITYINIINLYASVCYKRIKEVGIRLANGSHKTQLVVQFMVEALLINAMGVILAITLTQMTIPTFENAFDLNTILEATPWYWYVVELTSILIIGTLMLSIYPAYMVLGSNLSEGIAEKSLKSEAGLKWRGRFLIVQFGIAILLVAATIGVYQQLTYITNYDIGLNLKQKLVIKNPEFDMNDEAIKDKMAASFSTLSEVVSVTNTDAIPGIEVYWRSNEYSRIKNERSKINFTNLNVADDYFEVMKAELKDGSGFSKGMNYDEVAIINESAVYAMGFASSEEAVDATIFLRDHPIRILGVVEDFYQEGLKSNVEPTVYRATDENLTYYIVSFSGTNLSGLIEGLEAQWNTLFPNSPFEYFFLDERYQRIYASDLRVQRFFTTFCILAIIISCIGLFGVSKQSLASRKKEIGIRKVLGASVVSITKMILKKYMIMLVVAYVVAMPLAYYGIERWNSNFMLQVDPGMLFFTLPLIALLLLILFSIGPLTLRESSRNPTESIRYE